jgi:hypothetical protein
MLKSWAVDNRETADEVEAGKNTTPAHAGEALKVKLMAVVRGSATTPSEGAAATQTTQPTK